MSKQPKSKMPVAAVLLALAALSTAALQWFLGRGFLLYYGDAQARWT